MTMSTKEIMVAAALAAALGWSYNAEAGIPVVDGISNAQRMMEYAVEIDEARKRLTEIRNQIRAVRDQAQMIRDLEEGNYKDLFHDILSDPETSAYLGLSEWSDVYKELGSIEDLERELGYWEGLIENSDTEERLSMSFQALALLEKAHSKSVDRQKRLANLTDRYEQADNPAKKADLQSAIAFEQVQLANDTEMLKNLNAMMSQKQQLVAERQHAESQAQLLEKVW